MSATAGSDRPGAPLAAGAIEALFVDTPLAGRVRAFELWGRGDEAAIAPTEAAVVANAVENRRSQFAAGRQCAHRAIAELTTTATAGDRPTPGGPIVAGPIVDRPILPDDGRAPQWPPGVVGSISHTEGYAVAAVAAGDATDETSPTLGVDAERLGRVTDELHERLFVSGERAWLDGIESPVARDAATTLAFGAKEAFYKAQYPVTGAWVGFHDVELRPDPADPQLLVLQPATDLAALSRFAWPVFARGTIRRSVSIVAVVATRA